MPCTGKRPKMIAEFPIAIIRHIGGQKTIPTSKKKNKEDVKKPSLPHKKMELYGIEEH